MFPTIVTGNMEQHVNRAAEFLPERWLKSPSDSLYRIHPFASLPYGHGARMCLGRRFADMEIQILLAKASRCIITIYIPCALQLICLHKKKNPILIITGLCGPEVSGWLRLQITRHSAHEGGKVVTLTHRPPLPPGISWYSFLEAESICVQKNNLNILRNKYFINKYNWDESKIKCELLLIVR